jgi:hypothetical protein
VNVRDSSGSIFFTNTQLLTVPGQLAVPTPPAQVSFTIGTAGADGSIPITLASTATALFMTLFTLADGRFSDNVLTVLPPLLSAYTTPMVVTFIPFSPGQEDVLATSLRMDHLQKYFL